MGVHIKKWRRYGRFSYCEKTCPFCLSSDQNNKNLHLGCRVLFLKLCTVKSWILHIFQFEKSKTYTKCLFTYSSSEWSKKKERPRKWVKAAVTGVRVFFYAVQILSVQQLKRAGRFQNWKFIYQRDKSALARDIFHIQRFARYPARERLLSLWCRVLTYCQFHGLYDWSHWRRANEQNEYILIRFDTFLTDCRGIGECDSGQISKLSDRIRNFKVLKATFFKYCETSLKSLESHVLHPPVKEPKTRETCNCRIESRLR